MFPWLDPVGALLLRYTDAEGHVTSRAPDDVVRPGSVDRRRQSQLERRGGVRDCTAAKTTLGFSTSAVASRLRRPRNRRNSPLGHRGEPQDPRTGRVALSNGEYFKTNGCQEWKRVG
ncbi:hypothetical protein SY2F82_41410 [Streptomyces sp. Y2F8-2]|nr:hypothetical protein SY2F82_41410 [Streptomyces sp. Y2F8-2]